jgi:short subunit fatty acids transporter
VGYVYFLGMADVPEAQAFVASALFSVQAVCINWGLGGIVLALFPLRATDRQSLADAAR